MNYSQYGKILYQFLNKYISKNHGIIRHNSYSINMVKAHYYQQKSIEDAQNAENDYDDEHYEHFHDLLFNELLVHIKHVPFDKIIDEDLLYKTEVYRTKEANSLVWLYRADRKFINSISIYSFRFANLCNPERYQTFNVSDHNLFLLVPQQRHGFNKWYKYTGEQLLNKLDKYLNINKVVRGSVPHKTKLFINQEQERMDIQFSFDSIAERIVITFESGYPASRF